LTTYKPVAISFNPVGSIPTTPNATFLVGYVDGNPGGASALPIKDGVAAGIDIARYPAFLLEYIKYADEHWSYYSV